MTELASIWPKVSTIGWVRLKDYGGELVTRVEDFKGDAVVIGVPFGNDGETIVPPGLGHEFFVGWANDRAAIEVPVSLSGVAHQPIPVWECSPIGPPIETQRRRFVRIPHSMEVQVHLFEGEAMKALTLDLSEGGTLLSIDKWATDPGLRHFGVTLPLATGELSVNGQVVRWGNLKDERREVGIRFVDLDMKTADTIRRNVFALQLEQRRMRIDS